MGILLSSLIFLLAIYLLFVKEKHQKSVLYGLSTFLLLYKMIEYTLYGLNLDMGKIPIEYSTITYFLFGITVVFNLKSLKPLAAFMGFLSGLGYLMSFMFLAPAYFANNGIYMTVMALINHSIVFIGALILMRQEKFQIFDKKKILLFTSIYVLYVLVMHRLISFQEPFIFILMLLDGKFLDLLIKSSPTSYDYLFYFFMLLMSYQFIIKIFIWFNHKLHRIKEGQSHEYTI